MSRITHLCIYSNRWRVSSDWTFEGAKQLETVELRPDLLRQLLLQSRNPPPPNSWQVCAAFTCVKKIVCCRERPLWCFAPVVALRLNDAWIVHGSGPPTVFPPSPVSSLLSQHWLTAPLPPPRSPSSILLTGLHTEACTQAGGLTDRQCRQADMVEVQVHSGMFTLTYTFIWFFFSIVRAFTWPVKSLKG